MLGLSGPSRPVFGEFFEFLDVLVAVGDAVGEAALGVGLHLVEALAAGLQFVDRLQRRPAGEQPGALGLNRVDHVALRDDLACGGDQRFAIARLFLDLGALALVGADLHGHLGQRDWRGRGLRRGACGDGRRSRRGRRGRLSIRGKTAQGHCHGDKESVKFHGKVTVYPVKRPRSQPGIEGKRGKIDQEHRKKSGALCAIFLITRY